MAAKGSHVALKFSRGRAAAARDLSAAARMGDTLFVAGDEGRDIEVFARQGEEWRQTGSVSLSSLIDLPKRKGEVDVEGMDIHGGWLWIAGSHTCVRPKPEKKKSARKALRAFSKVSPGVNRFLLARIPIAEPPNDVYLLKRDGDRRAAHLPASNCGNTLTKSLAKDALLAPFLALPSKENGLDIEGLAVGAGHIWLGLRGPVLRGLAIVLRLDLSDAGGDKLKARKFDGALRHRKYLLDLDGFGIRDLIADGKDLLLLTGPTMSAGGASRIYRWRNALSETESRIVPKRRITCMQDLGVHENTDKPEALAHWTDNSLLLLRDSPGPDRYAARTRTYRAEILEIA